MDRGAWLATVHGAVARFRHDLATKPPLPYLLNIWDLARKTESFPEMAQFSSVARSCPTLCDPMDCSLLGSSVHGIFQPRVLEWGAIAFSISEV